MAHWGPRSALWLLSAPREGPNWRFERHWLARVCEKPWVFAIIEKWNEKMKVFVDFACIAFSRLSCRREWFFRFLECRQSEFPSKWQKSISGLWCRRELDLLDFVKNFMKNRSVSEMRVFEGCPMRNARFLKSCMNFHWFSGDFSEALFEGCLS